MPLYEIDAPVHKVLRTPPPLYAILVRPYPPGGGNGRIWVRTLISGYIFVKAISRNGRSVGHIASSSHMPFPDMRRGIARLPESSCHGRHAGIQIVALLTLPVAGPFVQECVNAHLQRKHSGGKPTTGRRADGCGRIVLFELQAFFGQTVNVRSGRELAAITAHIAYAHVVNIDNHHIRMFLRLYLRHGKQSSQPWQMSANIHL